MKEKLKEKRKDILYQKFFLFAIFFSFFLMFYFAFELVRSFVIDGDFNNQDLYELISVLPILLIAQTAYKGSIKNKNKEEE